MANNHMIILFILMSTVLVHPLDMFQIEHFVYHHIGNEQYYSLSNVNCGEQYYVVSISNEPHMIITSGKYDTPEIITDKNVIKKVLVCYYGLTSDNASSLLNESLEQFNKFKSSMANDTYYDKCIKFLGLYKSWCYDEQSCRNVCFHSEINCRPVMLALRWEFLDAMVDYANTTKRINMIVNTTYHFNTSYEFKDYVDAVTFVHSAERNLGINPLISRWNICGVPTYDWDSAKMAYLYGLKAYYAKYPTESLEELGQKVYDNSKERILMFRVHNYVRETYG
ncbi:hypothetical protein J7J90_01395 [Candidatus Micrarchaeota archaeon]|nr:hypothetical protein [Candidatus Micrarchaeota archaeon]